MVNSARGQASSALGSATNEAVLRQSGGCPSWELRLEPMHVRVFIFGQMLFGGLLAYCGGILHMDKCYLALFRSRRDSIL